MGRERLNKLNHIEKANRLFETRNRRTIMEQVEEETITCYICSGGTVNSMTWPASWVNNQVGPWDDSDGFSPLGADGMYGCAATDPFGSYNGMAMLVQNYGEYAWNDPADQALPMFYWATPEFPTIQCNSGTTETSITGTTLEGPFCCDLNSNSYGFGPDGVSVNIDGAVDMYVMQNGPEGELCDETLCKPCDASQMVSYLASFEPAPGISTIEFCAKCQTGSWDPFFGGTPEQCECCEAETDTDTPTKGGYNCKTGLMGSGCVPCGPSGDCEFESLGACQNSGCEDDTKSKGNNKKTKQRKKPEKLREEYTRMKTLWGYKF